MIIYQVTIYGRIVSHYLVRAENITQLKEVLCKKGWGNKEYHILPIHTLPPGLLPKNEG